MNTITYFTMVLLAEASILTAETTADYEKAIGDAANTSPLPNDLDFVSVINVYLNSIASKAIQASTRHLDKEIRVKADTPHLALWTAIETFPVIVNDIVIVKGDSTKNLAVVVISYQCYNQQSVKFKDENDKELPGYYKLFSNILTVDVSLKSDVTKIDLTSTLYHSKNISSHGHDLVCARWDDKENQWSKKDCKWKYSTDLLTTCDCKRIGSFAIFMAPKPTLYTREMRMLQEELETSTSFANSANFLREMGQISVTETGNNSLSMLYQHQSLIFVKGVYSKFPVVFASAELFSTNSGFTRAVNIVYNNTHLEPVKVQTGSGVQTSKAFYLISNIFHVAADKYPLLHVDLRFWHIRKVQGSSNNYFCAAWNHTSEIWSLSGCWSKDSSPSLTTCRCKHLESQTFALFAFRKVTYQDYLSELSSVGERLDDRVSPPVAMSIAEEIESIGMHAAETLPVNAFLDLKTKHITLNLGKSDASEAFSFLGNSTDSSLIVKTKQPTVQSLVGIVYDDIHLNLLKELKFEDQNNDSFGVISKVVSASVGSPKSVQSVTLTLNHLKIDSKQEASWTQNAICAFWDINGKEWSTKGCIKLSSNETHTSCRCDHLTNFAILMATKSLQNSKTHGQILSMLTIVCGSVSIIFLVIGLAVFIFIMCQQNQRHTKLFVHSNLMFSLLISQMLFIMGAEFSKTSICLGSSYVLHYFTLSSFGWMLVEGMYLYLTVVRVFEDVKRYMRSFCAFGYLVPFLVVLATALASPNNYNIELYCWLSHKGAWAFLGPMIVIVFFNMMVLIRVVYQINRLSKTEPTASSVKRSVRSSIILLPILGVGWIFGFLIYTSVFFQYIFVLINVLQGFLVTLFHCFCNTEVRQLFKRRLQTVYLTSGFCDVIARQKDDKSSTENSTTQRSGNVSSMHPSPNNRVNPTYTA